MRILKGFLTFNSIVISSLFLSLSACDKKETTKLNFETSDAKQTKLSQWYPATETSGTVSVTVVDQSARPISNAKVLIGSALGQPFKNNFLETDKNGQVSISREDWTNPAHVTADAANYIRQTLLTQKPGNIVIKMNSSQLRSKARISGVVSGLPVTDGDKNIDFGLIMSSLSKADLFNFDISNVISPYSDTLSALGQEFAVPSNTSLPKQKEKYIINITLEKPVYSLYMSSLGTKRLFSAAGRFPFKPVVDELRAGKPFYELINYFNLSGGTIREVNVTGAETQLNFPAQELKFTKSVSVKSPRINPDEVFLSLMASEIGGQLVPTGVRKLNSEEKSELTAIDGSPLFLINALKRQAEFMGNVPGGDRITASILPYKADLNPELLPLANNPTISFSNGYIGTIPQVSAPDKMTQLAVFAAISDLFEDTVGNQKITTYVKKWDILGTQWPRQILLPNWPLDKGNQKKRFEVNLIAGLNAKQHELGDELVQASTHVTRSSVDF